MKHEEILKLGENETEKWIFTYYEDGTWTLMGVGQQTSTKGMSLSLNEARGTALKFAQDKVQNLGSQR